MTDHSASEIVGIGSGSEPVTALQITNVILFWITDVIRARLFCSSSQFDNAAAGAAPVLDVVARDGADFFAAFLRNGNIDHSLEALPL